MLILSNMQFSIIIQNWDQVVGGKVLINYKITLLSVLHQRLKRSQKIGTLL